MASSFRYPTVDDRIGTSAYNVSHNFQLKPQRSQDFEIGHTYSNKRVVLTNNFFYMRLRDEIYFDAKSYLNVNLDATERYGIESSIDINVNSNISLNNSFSAIKTNLRKASLHANHAKGSEIPGVPSMTNKTQLNLKYDKYLNFFTNIYYRSTTRMINDSQNFQVKNPEYYLVNCGIKTNLENYNLSLELNNLFDKAYYYYPYGSASTYNSYNTYPLPGFNMMLKISTRFN